MGLAWLLFPWGTRLFMEAQLYVELVLGDVLAPCGGQGPGGVSTPFGGFFLPMTFSPGMASF